MNGLYRGEAGSRNNDLKSNIDPKEIIRVDIGFSTKNKTATSLYLDNLRLTKESRPAGILAFDLGAFEPDRCPRFHRHLAGHRLWQEWQRRGMNFAGTDGQAR